MTTAQRGPKAPIPADLTESQDPLPPRDGSTRMQKVDASLYWTCTRLRPPRSPCCCLLVSQHTLVHHRASCLMPEGG